MTKILAHRGANKHAPQNTIPAFLKAIELERMAWKTTSI